MRLGTKIAVFQSALVVIVLSALGALDVSRDQAYFVEDTARDQLAIASVLATSTELELANGARAPRVDALVERTGDSGHLRAAWGWADEPAPAVLPVLPDEVWETLRRDGHATFRLPGEAQDQWTLVRGSAPDSRPFFVAIGEDLAPERAHLHSSVVRTGTSIGALALLCALAMVALGRRFITRPMGRLVDHARAVASGDLESRLAVAQDDEVGQLTAEMNAMTDGLAASRELLEKETERRVAALEQLRHADRLTTVGKLASGLAHELGTPLNVVHGYARLIVSADVADEVKKSAETILGQTERMTRLVRQLLDFARRKGPRRAPVELSRLVHKVATVLKPTAQKKGVEIVEKGAVSDSIEADATMIEQVLTNLIFNALQASETRAGPVTVEVSTAAELEAAPGRSPGRYVRISVEDHGAGIAPENLDHIFEPFFTTKQVGDGTGLGLSVSHGIVQDHGGFIDVSSELGKGSTFHVYLPASSSAEVEQQSDRAAGTKAGGPQRPATVDAPSHPALRPPA